MAVPPALVWVHSQRPLPPSIASVTLVANDKGDNFPSSSFRMISQVKRRCQPDTVRNFCSHVKIIIQREKEKTNGSGDIGHICEDGTSNTA